MTGLSSAVARRDWETAALYLLLGFLQTAGRLPRGTAADLIAQLSADQTGGG